MSDESYHPADILKDTSLNCTTNDEKKHEESFPLFNNAIEELNAMPLPEICYPGCSPQNSLLAKNIPTK